METPRTTETAAVKNCVRKKASRKRHQIESCSECGHYYADTSHNGKPLCIGCKALVLEALRSGAKR